MKELSIEEKAKACEEAYKRVAIRFGSNVADEIFPEFKESEDERIRRELIRDIDIAIPIETAQRYIAWVEKQGKQETDEWKEGNIIRHGGILALVIKGRRAMKSNGELFTVQYSNEWVKAVPNEIERFLNELEKQVEQKTTWTEEDENMLNDILMCGEHHCYLDTANIAWLKSIKDRYAFS